MFLNLLILKLDCKIVLKDRKKIFEIIKKIIGK